MGAPGGECEGLSPPTPPFLGLRGGCLCTLEWRGRGLWGEWDPLPLVGTKQGGPLLNWGAQRPPMYWCDLYMGVQDLGVVQNSPERGRVCVWGLLSAPGLSPLLPFGEGLLIVGVGGQRGSVLKGMGLSLSQGFRVCVWRGGGVSATYGTAMGWQEGHLGF